MKKPRKPRPRHPFAHVWPCENEDSQKLFDKKPRWGGLPDGAGWWEWWADKLQPKAILVYVEDAGECLTRNFGILLPTPAPNLVCGLSMRRLTGRTVGTMGGLWGKKVAD